MKATDNAIRARLIAKGFIHTTEEKLPQCHDASRARAIASRKAESPVARRALAILGRHCK